MSEFKFDDENDRPLDWQDKLVIATCAICGAACLAIMIWGR